MFSRHSRQQNSTFRKNPRSKSRVGFNYLPMMLSGLLLGLVIAGGIWVWQRLNDPHTLPFHEIRISGQFQHLNANQLRQTLQPQIHSGFFALKLAPLKQSLMTNPWVEDVAIRRIPGTLYVNVREQQPVARWNDRYLINSDDQLFLAPRDAPAGLPLLQGPEENQALILGNYKQINRLLQPLGLSVQQLQLDQRQSWELVLSNGITVTIGREDVLMRIQRLAHWYPQIVSDKVSEIVHIDLRYANNISVQFNR